jgi:predicted Zn-dependent peptidase
MGRIESAHSLRLGTGFALHVIPTRRFKTVTLRLVLRRPLDALSTAAALMESLLRRGCRGYPTMRIINQFFESLYGASFSSDVSKLGDQQAIAFSLRVLNDRFAPRPIRAVEQALDFLARLLSAPTKERGLLRRDYFEQERENLRRFLEGMINDRPGYALLRAVEVMCKDEPYGIPEYGRLEDLPGLTVESITSLHSQCIELAPIDLFVVGDVDSASLRRAVARAFKRALRRKRVSPLPGTGRPPAPERPREVVEELEVEQARLILGWRAGVSTADDEYPALVTANGIFGSFPHSRLFRIVREEAGLAYQAGSFLDSEKGLLVASLGIDAGAFEKARDLAIRQWDAIAAGKIERDEFDKTRSVLLHHYRSRGDSPGAMIQEVLEGVHSGRRWPAHRLMTDIAALDPAQVAAAARRARLDTVYLLRSPPRPNRANP